MQTHKSFKYKNISQKIINPKMQTKQSASVFRDKDILQSNTSILLCKHSAQQTIIQNLPGPPLYLAGVYKSAEIKCYGQG